MKVRYSHTMTPANASFRGRLGSAGPTARTLLIEDERLLIRVRDGEVRLSGKLERRTDAELLDRFASRVLGVGSVRSTVRWEWDDRKASLESCRRVPIAPRR
jgi:hypothetical protein